MWTINDVFVQDMRNDPYCPYGMNVVGCLVKGATYHLKLLTQLCWLYSQFVQWIQNN